MRKIIRGVGIRSARIGLAAALALSGLALAATPAAATTRSAAPVDDTVPRVKEALTNRIDLRLRALNRDRTLVTAARALTDDHRRELSTVVDSAITGLTRLKEEVAGETTVSALRVDAATMVNDFRVFKLIGPKVRLTIAGDVAAIAIERAERAHGTLSELVADEKAAGTDTAAAEADLADMAAAIEAARAHLDGQVAALLAIEPGPDGAAITNAVSAVRRAIGATRGDLRTALAEGRSVLAFLRTNR